jgi:phosphoribosylformimino-5-aminoimidazole carboxamide ribotide isomerase
VILYPALDILHGQVVRLTQGDFEQSTTYASDPLAAAQIWAAAGAERLHIVDLDGARRGEPVNLDHVRQIAEHTGLEIEFGGGLRSLAAIDAAVAAGAGRAVIGTAAFGGSDVLERALAAHGERIAVSVDARADQVATAGWTQTTGLGPLEAIAVLRERGVHDFIYTDVERDGMLGGLDLEAISLVADAVDGALIYAGGIGELDDLTALVGLGHPHLAGVIVGKALYEERFTIAEANAVLCS